MAHVVFELKDGSLCRMEHGDQIGRSPRAALTVDDRRVSEAHAQISQRGSGLTLLALRGEVWLDGEPVRESRLRMGQTYELPGGHTLFVADVDHHTGTLAAEATERLDDPPLEIVAQFETVTLSGGGLTEPVVLTGLKALVLIELIRAGEPVHWHRLARRIWPIERGQSVEEHKESVRARWYQLTARIRQQLLRAGLERPLVLANAGILVLATLPEDSVVDASD